MMVARLSVKHAITGHLLWLDGRIGWTGHQRQIGIEVDALT